MGFHIKNNCLTIFCMKMVTAIYLSIISVLFRFEFLVAAKKTRGNFQESHIIGGSEAMAKFRNFLLQAQTESGNADLNIFLTKNIQDYISINDFETSSTAFPLHDIFCRFSDIYLHGLKSFRINKVSVDLGNMRLNVNLSIPILRVVGNYSASGIVTFFSVSGEGPFWMNLSSIIMNGYSPIEITPDGRLSVGDINFDFDVENLDVYFEDLKFGGSVVPMNDIIDLTELITGRLKHDNLNNITSYIKKQINDILLDNIPNNFFDSSSSNVANNLFDQAVVYLQDHGLEPLLLPNYKEIYESVFFMMPQSELKLFKGILHGMSTVNRKGNVIIEYVNNSLIFEAKFGFENITGSYTWRTKAFGFSKRGGMEVQVKGIEGFVRIKQELTAGSKLLLDEFYLEDIQHVWLDLKRFGRWDCIIESVINLVANGLKLHLADAITIHLVKRIQNQLDLLNIGLPS